MNNELELNSKKPEILRDEKGRLLPGQASINPNGRPKGAKNFYTDFKSALKTIKDSKTGDVITEVDIIAIGVKKMLKGDARFEGLYRDLLDRIYGKPQQDIGITGNDLLPTKVIVEIVEPNTEYGNDFPDDFKRGAN